MKICSAATKTKMAQKLNAQLPPSRSARMAAQAGIGSRANSFSSVSAQAEEEFHLRMAKEISERRKREYINRGDDPEIAADLAGITRRTFSQKREDSWFLDDII